MKGKRLQVAAAFLFLICQVAIYAQATKMYWTEWSNYSSTRSRAAKANINGTGVETVADGMQAGSGPKGIAVDNTNNHVYIANKGDQKIERCNLDGSGRVTLLTSVYPMGIALDVVGGKMYWCDYTWGDPKIMRANLDGTGSETIIDGLSNGCVLEAIALDVPNNKLYWAERMDKEIWQANLDGSSASKILSCCSKSVGTYGLAVFNGKLYWSNSSTIEKAIRRSDLNGDNQEVVIYVTPHIWSPDLKAPMAKPEAFTIKEDEDNLTDFEKLNKK